MAHIDKSALLVLRTTVDFLAKSDSADPLRRSLYCEYEQKLLLDYVPNSLALLLRNSRIAGAIHNFFGKHNTRLIPARKNFFWHCLSEAHANGTRGFVIFAAGLDPLSQVIRTKFPDAVVCCSDRQPGPVIELSAEQNAEVDTTDLSNPVDVEKQITSCRAAIGTGTLCLVVEGVLGYLENAVVNNLIATLGQILLANDQVLLSISFSANTPAAHFVQKLFGCQYRFRSNPREFENQLKNGGFRILEHQSPAQLLIKLGLNSQEIDPRINSYAEHLYWVAR